MPLFLLRQPTVTAAGDAQQSWSVLWVAYYKPGSMPVRCRNHTGAELKKSSPSSSASRLDCCLVADFHELRISGMKPRRSAVPSATQSTPIASVSQHCSGPFALNAEPERAFRFSSAFERVRTQGTSAISGGRNLIENITHQGLQCPGGWKRYLTCLGYTETPANDKLSSRKFTRRLRDSKPSSNDIETALNLPRREGSGSNVPALSRTLNRTFGSDSSIC
ncbi:hypothetical protein DFH08DRAFT_824650 [Mycena albidolilacea]|uniref:Uncharacterized protein n=1 Tax=Mycena albidolilacea TaxID=1033008 RepID=A0AAD6Z4A3_9AGAR|nr:hypothetical protein DFH08DRAFT_824650 [Mycena albidolilacea]